MGPWHGRASIARLQAMQLPFFSKDDAFEGRTGAWLGGVAVLVISFFSVFYNFWTPRSFFWDENYHVAAAQKYLNGVFFMEPHPPLGKLVIAAGEALLGFNTTNDQFIGTDYANNPPEDFVMTGFRLFPTLLAWLSAPLLFLCFLALTKKPLHATLLSFFYMFDNAILVQVRAAMLEGTLIFFCALTILSFLLLRDAVDRPKRCLWLAALFGVAWGAAVTTKIFALIFLLLLPTIAWWLRKSPALLLQTLGVIAATFLLTGVAVWQVHFAVGTSIQPSLSDEGYYQASDTYKTYLEEGKNRSLTAFPVMLRDSMAYMHSYESGVPKLNLCKDDENGSPWFFWPVGGRTISYRWETPDNSVYQYLYLVPNPVVWGLALLAVLFAVSLVFGALFGGGMKDVKDLPLLLTFLALYCGFFAAVAHIERVLYLYHYFLPLIFGMLLVPLCVSNIRSFGTKVATESAKTTLLLVLSAMTFLSFQYFRPLTYYEPMSDEAVARRALLPIWELRCARCTRDSKIALPVVEQKVDVVE